MEDTSAREEARAKKKIPFLLAGVIALLAYFAPGGLWSAILVFLAFLVGYLPVEKVLFLVDGIEERRRIGRKALDNISEANISRILPIINSGRKIEAIKQLRAINGDGLKESKEAIDLLSDFGLDWRRSIDNPPNH